MSGRDEWWAENCITKNESEGTHTCLRTYLYPPGDRGRAERELQAIAGEDDSYPYVVTFSWKDKPDDSRTFFFAPDFNSDDNYDPCSAFDRYGDIEDDDLEVVHWETVRQAAGFLGYLT